MKEYFLRNAHKFILIWDKEGSKCNKKMTPFKSVLILKKCFYLKIYL